MAGKTALRTGWVKVCTSGNTIDGRNISSQDIEDMAAAYRPEEYTAVINYEHYNWAGNFGTVLELKAEKNKAGEMCLFAILEPNKHLMDLNAEGQKVFTSIELQPNFADTGKAYLSGLALTDSPASRGTTQLNFSHRVNKEHVLSDPLEFNLNLPTEIEQVPGWFTNFISKFQPASFGANTPTEDEDMTKEQQAEMLASIEATFDKKFTAIKAELSKEPDGDGEAGGSEGGSSESVAFSQEQATKLQGEVTALSEQVTALTATIDKLSNTAGGEETPLKGGAGKRLY